MHTCFKFHSVVREAKTEPGREPDVASQAHQQDAKVVRAEFSDNASASGELEGDRQAFLVVGERSLRLGEQTTSSAYVASCGVVVEAHAVIPEDIEATRIRQVAEGVDVSSLQDISSHRSRSVGLRVLVEDDAHRLVAVVGVSSVQESPVHVPVNGRDRALSAHACALSDSLRDQVDRRGNDSARCHGCIIQNEVVEFEFPSLLSESAFTGTATRSDETTAFEWTDSSEGSKVRSHPLSRRIQGHHCKTQGRKEGLAGITCRGFSSLSKLGVDPKRTTGREDNVRIDLDQWITFFQGNTSPGKTSDPFLGGISKAILRNST